MFIVGRSWPSLAEYKINMYQVLLHCSIAALCSQKTAYHISNITTDSISSQVRSLIEASCLFKNNEDFFREKFSLDDSTNLSLIPFHISDRDLNGSKISFLCAEIDQVQTICYKNLENCPTDFIIPIPSSIKGLNKVQFTGEITNYDQNLFYRSASYYFEELLEVPRINSIIKINSPTYGSLSSNLLNIEINTDTNAYDQIVFEAKGLIKYTAPSMITNIFSNRTVIEAGSWFINITPLIASNKGESENLFANDRKGVVTVTSEQPSKDEQFGYQSHHYIEFVLPDDELLGQRLFRNRSYGDYTELQNELNNELENNWRPNVERMIEYRQEFARIQQLMLKFTKKIDINNYPYQAIENSYSKDQISLNRPDGHINICIWTSLRMDGQKRIWLQQIESLNEFLSYDSSDSRRFYFTVITAEGIHDYDSPDSMLYYLRNNINVDIVKNIFNYLTIPKENLSIKPSSLRKDTTMNQESSDESLSAEEYIRKYRVIDPDEDSSTLLYKYIRYRFLIANQQIHSISPRWCQELYIAMYNFLADIQCNVLIFGNPRGFSSEFFLTDIARLLDITTITELLNLFLDDSILPDIIIAPSTHSLMHHSIQDHIQARNTSSQHTHMKTIKNYPPVAVVVNPAVDFDLFDKVKYTARKQSKCLGDVVYHYHFREKQNEQTLSFPRIEDPCVLIGFMARLSNEKNPGLFLQAAHIILKTNPFARFVIIGDGILKSDLKKLSERLQISHAISFVGWVAHEQLPSVLSDIDIIVNPSLRGWSETFCIANIEAMSMEIPLVTFAVGGVGEYIQAPNDCSSNKQNSSEAVVNDQGYCSNGDWEVVSNAVLVNKAYPEILAEAVLYLVDHPQERERLGREARRSIIHHFNVRRQMQQYASLYRLATRKNSQQREKM